MAARKKKPIESSHASRKTVDAKPTTKRRSITAIVDRLELGEGGPADLSTNQTVKTASKKSKPAASSTAGYLAGLGAPQREALDRLRMQIMAVDSRLVEGFSYKMPAFNIGGKDLLWLGAAAKHCAIYGVVGTDGKEFANYDTSGRGTVRFELDAPLPATLVRKIVKAAIARTK